MKTSSALRNKRRDTKERANDIFAKIISKENLVLRRSRFSKTASFSPEARLLTLPIFARSAPNFVEEGMIIHEVGHALYTTVEFMDRYKDELAPRGIPFGLVNILEDVRINKLMAIKYKGVRAIHNVYYEYLCDEGFFGNLKRSNITFPDMINVFFKVGPHSGIDIKSTPEWKLFGDKIVALKTEDDVIELAVEIAEYYKEKKQEDQMESGEAEQETPPQAGDEEGEPSTPQASSQSEDAEDKEEEAESDDTDNSSDSDDDASSDADSDAETESDGGANEETDKDEEGESNDSKSKTSAGEEKEEDKSSTEAETNDSGDNGASNNDNDLSSPELESTTNEEFEKNLERFVKDEDPYSTNDINTLRIEKDVYKKVVGDFGDLLTMKWKENVDKNYSFHDSHWKPLMAEIKPVVNRMVNDFEAKKSAADFARTMVSDSGSLDITKLHQYKIEDDIFLKNQYTPEGKSHGIVLLLDGSGSMKGARYKKVVKQAIIMAMFAKRVNIPFSVFQFTNGSPSCNIAGKIAGTESEEYINFAGLWLHKILDHTLKLRDLNTRMEKIYEIAHAGYVYKNTNWSWETGGYGNTAGKEFQGNSLESKRAKVLNDKFSRIFSGTPTEVSIFALIDYIKQFKINYSVEINTFMILTDGDSGGFSNQGFCDKLDDDNLRIAFDSSNKSYDARTPKKRRRYSTATYVEAALEILKKETQSNVIEIKLDSLTSDEKTKIQKTGFIHTSKPHSGVDMRVQYTSEQLRFAGIATHTDDLVNEMILVAKKKKVDIMFASLVSDLIARNF